MSKSHYYEYIETIDKILKDKTRYHALDIGANVGEVTSYLSANWNQVTAFEPTPNTFEILCNNVSSNVTCENIGISNHEGHLHFITGKDQRKNQIVSENFHKKGWDKISIPVRPLDSYKFDNIDFMKIDVEGHERYVVLGAENTIKQCNPLIVIEISFEKKVYDKEMSKNHTDALSILESWNYEIIEKHRHDYILKRK